MAEAIRVTVDLAGFGEFLAAAQAALEQAVEQSADAIVDAAQPLAAVDTGFMRDHIIARQVDAFHWEVDSEADYSAHVEYGTARMPGRPFMTPAVEAERARFPERIAKALAEAEKG